MVNCLFAILCLAWEQPLANHNLGFGNRILQPEDSKRRGFESHDQLHLLVGLGVTGQMLIPEDCNKPVQDLYILRDTHGVTHEDGICNYTPESIVVKDKGPVSLTNKPTYKAEITSL